LIVAGFSVQKVFSITLYSSASLIASFLCQLYNIDISATNQAHSVWPTLHD